MQFISWVFLNQSSYFSQQVHSRRRCIFIKMVAGQCLKPLAKGSLGLIELFICATSKFQFI